VAVLSPLGDRLCLALALRLPRATVLTADRSWARLDLPLDVVLLR
jgi:PIN domain nuclease of toxin-antitoxin system